MCSPADQELINLAKIRYSLVILNILKIKSISVTDAVGKQIHFAEGHR